VRILKHHLITNISRKSSLFISLFLLTGVLISCSKNQSPAEYEKSIIEWRENRVESLTAPGGWLSLSGLYWLEDGTYSLGSDTENELIFPEKAPADIGEIDVKGNEVQLYPSESAEIKLTENHRDAEEVKEISNISKGVILNSDRADNTNYVQVGDYEFYLIQRGERLALRLIDYNHPKVEKFEGLDYFPIDQKWKLEAEFIPNEDGSTIGVPNIMGGIYQEESPGKIAFEIEGKEYQLDVLPAYGGKQFFVILGDKTSGKSTYGGGRYLYMMAPKKGETTAYIDFNKAYNPPCAFTEFATCPLPPPQNRLDVAITAGEKDYHY